MKSKMILAYLFSFAVFSVIYLLLFRTPFFNSQTVLFYRGNLLLLVSFLITLVLMAIFRQKIKVSWESLIAALVLSASIHLAVFVVFPVTFDRSVTMYLLNRLNSSQSPTCNGLAKSKLEQLLIKEYVRENQAISRRINEQTIINMIKTNNQCVVLTDQGKTFLQFSKVMKKLYSID